MKVANPPREVNVPAGASYKGTTFVTVTQYRLAGANR
jgi:hypothetical protein